MNGKGLVLLGLVSIVLNGCGNEFNKPFVDLTDFGTSGTVDTEAPLSGVLPDSEASQPACELTQSQQNMLDLVNDARSQPRDCGGVAYSVAEPLIWNCELMAAAKSHTEDMASNDFFSHSGSDGLQVSSRVTAAEYDWRAVGENIAAGYPDESTAVVALLDSPGHCENIMNPDFREFGSAAEFTDRKVFPSYWTQVFAIAF